VPAIVWKDEYSVGVKVIDDQHKELFRRVNKLFDDVSRGNVTTVLETLDFPKQLCYLSFLSRRTTHGKSELIQNLSRTRMSMNGLSRRYFLSGNK